jgi:hypothetical protein
MCQKYPFILPEITKNERGEWVNYIQKKNQRAVCHIPYKYSLSLLKVPAGRPVVGRRMASEIEMSKTYKADVDYGEASRFVA